MSFDFPAEYKCCWTLLRFKKLLNHFKKCLTTFNYRWIAERRLIIDGVFFSKIIIVGVCFGEIREVRRGIFSHLYATIYLI